MKFFPIVASLAIAKTNAMYLACCKTTKDECPSNYNNVGSFNSMGGGPQFQACCNQNENLPEDKEGLFACIEPVSNGDGASVMVMAIKTEEEGPNTADPGASITSTSNQEVSSTSHEVSSTSAPNDCCEVAAAIQPAKLRSSPPPPTNCPNGMHSIFGAEFMKGPTKYEVCCDAYALASEVSSGGLACQKPDKPVDTPQPPVEPATCLVGDIMYHEGDSIGHIGWECTDPSSYQGTASTCGPNGEIVTAEEEFTCGGSVPYCVQCGPRARGAALCLSSQEIPAHCADKGKPTQISEPTQEGEDTSEGDAPTQIDEPAQDTDNEPDEDFAFLEGTNGSNSASAISMLAVGIALVAVAIQVAL